MNDLDGKIICIVMHDRHIYIGRVEVRQHGWVRLSSAVSVRYWTGAREPGHGLGRLLRTGPKSGDILDQCPGVRLVLPSPQAHVIECDQDAWAATCPQVAP